MQIVEHRTLFGKVGKGIVVAASGYVNTIQQKVVSPRNSGQLFNTSTVDRVKIEKRPAVALYLNELITSLKNVNSEITSGIHSPTWKGIPRRVHATVTNPA